MPDEMTSIGNYAFAWCSALQSVTIGSGVATIGNSAFYNCNNLSSVTIGNGVTSIGENAFAECYSLNTVVIPDNVATIGNYAFAWCGVLQSVTIGSAVTSLGEYAFRYCDNLVELNVLPVTPPSIYSNTFDSELNSSFAIAVPEGSLEDYRSDENWRRLLEISSGEASGVCGDNLVWTLNLAEGTLTISGSGSMYDYTYVEEVPWYSYRSYITNVSMSDEMTSIGNYAFYNCYNLSSVTIGSAVTSIGEYAFADCYSLNAVVIPDKVTTIGDYAFVGCYNLTSITCLAIVPPAVNNNFVSINPANCLLYVHQAAIEDYQGDPVWSLFMLERIETETPIEIYQLMLNVGENGSVLYDGTIFTSEHGTILLEMQEGTTPTMQILPNQGYGISSIMIGELDLTGQTDEDGYITLPAIMENTTCTVLFDEARYKVEYYFVGSHGSFYTTVAYGGSFTCNFAAHEGNVIESITLNGTDVTDLMENDNSITINNITENMILIFSTNDYSTNNQSVEQSRLRAWQAGNTIFTEVDETVKAVILYDISGRLMREYYHNGDYQVLTFPAPNQVNLLKVVGKDGTVATHKLM